MEISAIIPTLNEELTIKKTLDALSRLVNVDEIIIVDGGSTDKTIEIIENYQPKKPIRLVKTVEANRGKQLHEGTKHASGDIFWFLHADTRPVQGCAKQIKQYMRYDEVVGGNFEIIFDGESRWARILTWLYPKLRSIDLVYGDSAVFARRAIYEKIGGFRSLQLFEDVDLYKRLKKKGRFEHINLPVTTSSRRFENRSFIWTFTRWSIFQGLYWFGISPRLLAKGYQAIRK
ncbi:MAG: TIGR04283 family arsenosugar biosynthesis glycosyltransferase [Acidobacteria bacterium]|jgi:rSAM/selenodomain-associated transferase 2|nr:TIGR04283 family arsenosugar biosynthesis glycosyltransferase [Acidobacteriota bacterium]